MGVGVVADFVTGCGNLARDLWQAANIGADLKERGGRAMAGEDFEQLGCRFTGAVVEGERDGAPGAGAMGDRRRKPGAGWDSDRVGQRTGGYSGRRAHHVSKMRASSAMREARA